MKDLNNKLELKCRFARKTRTVNLLVKSCTALLSILFATALFSVHAQKLAVLNKTNENRAVDKFPVPVFNKLTQFYLQRTTDANTIVYDLNMENGSLNETEPIKAYWIRYKTNSEKQKLSYIQNKYAFGVKSTKVAKDHFKLVFAAYDKVPLHLKKQNNTYKTFVNLDNQEILLERLYIHIEPGSTFWSPNIAYIEFKGKNLSDGNMVIKRIVPK